MSHGPQPAPSRRAFVVGATSLAACAAVDPVHGRALEQATAFRLNAKLGGRSYVLALHNDTAWPHPIHLHGHSFRVISRNGQPTRHREWQDTVLLDPRERAEIAFVADNPGDWMLHCHILEHQAAGMMSVLRVR